MKKFNVSAVYFSPTDTSRRGALAIAHGLGTHIQEIDMTLWNSQPERTVFNARDLVVFGAPVYGGRIYRGARNRFRMLHGNQTPCIITVTYGNRDFNDALLEMYDLVLENGFLPFAAAALIGEHTYGKIQVGRPDEEDLSDDLNFAKKAFDKIHAEGATLVQVPGNRDGLMESQGGDGGGFRPLTNENCIQCGLCARQCPEGAISDSDYAAIDSEKCIACFRCIKRCPTHAKNIDTDEYNTFAKEFSERLSLKRSNKYFL